VVIKIALQFAAGIFSVVNEQNRHKLLAAAAIYFVETRGQRAVEVEDAEDAAFLDERHDELGARTRVAGDVARKIVHIGDQY
jgi:hypothetical protein